MVLSRKKEDGGETPLYLNKKNNTGCTPLHWAALEGNLPLARILINAGADITALNNREKTALNLAEEVRHADMIKFFSDFPRREPEDQIA